MKKSKKKSSIYPVTRAKLVAIYKQWELDSRMGKCVALEICKAQSIDENASKSADAFLNYLKTV